MFFCFKVYDICGCVLEELDVVFVECIGVGIVFLLGLGFVVLGCDICLSSLELQVVLEKGFIGVGCDVIDIGLCGIEEVYFQIFYCQVVGGVMVIVSYNLMGYNGMKLVCEYVCLISGDIGLFDVCDFVVGDVLLFLGEGVVCSDIDKIVYIQYLLGYVDVVVLKLLKIVVNVGNGGVGLVIDELVLYLLFEFICIQYEFDGMFFNGIFNLLLLENCVVMVDVVCVYGVDFGIVWDGDFDCCFFFDSIGVFIEGYYLVGLLVVVLFKCWLGGKIIYDLCLIWNMVEMVEQVGGVLIMSKIGYVFIKECMCVEDVIYGGEMSVYYYFCDFVYCDFGMILWLLIVELVLQIGMLFGDLVVDCMQVFFCSGEINFCVDDVKVVIVCVLVYYVDQVFELDYIDGVSVEFVIWCFNLCSFNIELFLWLNVEICGDVVLLCVWIEEFIVLIGG